MQTDRGHNSLTRDEILLFILLGIIVVLLWLYGILTSMNTLSSDLRAFTFTPYMIGYVLTTQKPTVFENITVNIYHIMYYWRNDKDDV